MFSTLKIWHGTYPEVQKLEIDFSELGWMDVIILRLFMKLLARKANSKFATLETM